MLSGSSKLCHALVEFMRRILERYGDRREERIHQKTENATKSYMNYTLPGGPCMLGACYSTWHAAVAARAWPLESSGSAHAGMAVSRRFAARARPLACCGGEYRGNNARKATVSVRAMPVAHRRGARRGISMGKRCCRSRSCGSRMLSLRAPAASNVVATHVPGQLPLQKKHQPLVQRVTAAEGPQNRGGGSWGGGEGNGWWVGLSLAEVGEERRSTTGGSRGTVRERRWLGASS